MRGDILDQAGIYRALCHHFKTGNPDNFHFHRHRRDAAGGRMLLDEKYGLGPSCTLARERSRQIAKASTQPHWLSTGEDIPTVKPVSARRDSTHASRLHSQTFPDSVWSELGSTLRALEKQTRVKYGTPRPIVPKAA